MIKYSFFLLGAYFLYYAGNIVYDLFFKKEKILQTDVTEEFSLGDFSELNTPTKIGIEDVENVNTPNSYLKKEFQSQKQVLEESKPEIEDLRRRFELEQDIDDDFVKGNVQENSTEENTITITESATLEASTSKYQESTTKKTDWRSLLKLSETTVQMVANYEGQKVYHSTL